MRTARNKKPVISGRDVFPPPNLHSHVHTTDTRTHNIRVHYTQPQKKGKSTLRLVYGRQKVCTLIGKSEREVEAGRER